jgi:hypothetical protein
VLGVPVTGLGGELTKQQQFLWIVQTALLVNVVNQTIEWKQGSDRSNVSMTGNWTAITEPLWASARIPNDLTAEEAAHEYCYYMFDNQRASDEKATGRKMAVPGWFARG